ncbi:hypothetical protein [Rhizobium herbae]|uniref:Uncharacterized protein n=1 Tax=Rhizobium herbae TaxID=508661 RepID=A0ABS4EME6_9HYPH|nr:hypothetical protein [Rhizobium herbae]MBP1859083.1 hypothetical protein [Rhizobium herbae]
MENSVNFDLIQLKLYDCRSMEKGQGFFGVKESYADLIAISGALDPLRVAVIEFWNSHKKNDTCTGDANLMKKLWERIDRYQLTRNMDNELDRACVSIVSSSTVLDHDEIEGLVETAEILGVSCDVLENILAKNIIGYKSTLK